MPLYLLILLFTTGIILFFISLRMAPSPGEYDIAKEKGKEELARYEERKERAEIIHHTGLAIIIGVAILFLINPGRF